MRECLADHIQGLAVLVAWAFKHGENNEVAHLKVVCIGANGRQAAVFLLRLEPGYFDVVNICMLYLP